MLSSPEPEHANHGDAVPQDCYEEEIPLQDLLADFGARFVRKYRQQVAQHPTSVTRLDLVDVFANSGEFLFRGVVERVQGTHAFVSSIPTGKTHRVLATSCRHASAGPLPGSLAEWEAAHGA